MLKVVVKLTMKPEQLGAKIAEHLKEKKNPIVQHRHLVIYAPQGGDKWIKDHRPSLAVQKEVESFGFTISLRPENRGRPKA